MTRWLCACAVNAYAHSEGPDKPVILRSVFRDFAVILQNHWILQRLSMYSRTSVDRTSLGHGNVVDMGSSTHRGLILAPGQEANGANLGKSFRFSTQ